jgi:t-SNARE complex subunit (syntaxin)
MVREGLTNLNLHKCLLTKVFHSMLQQTKNIYEIEDEEDVKRIRKIKNATESILNSFNNIAYLVMSQGQLIDRIDKNIEQGGIFIRNSNYELNKLYESYNSCAYSCQICLTISILVFSIIFAIKLII